MRQRVEDFRVDEILGYEADGEGDHALIQVEKRGANSEWVANELARFAGVKPVAVGYAGRKDRHAVTRQAFSVDLSGRPIPNWTSWPHQDVHLLCIQPHRRKIKRGSLRGNRFVLMLRDVEGDRPAAEKILRTAQARGIPNYFGEQRFGHGGGNLDQARAMFKGRRVRRAQRGLLLSAARSAIFNAVLGARVADACWDQPMGGEIWCLRGSRTWFGPEPFSDELRARSAALDIHPSGPLWGEGDTPAGMDCAELERRIAAELPELAAGLAAAGLKQQRRALRLVTTDLEWRWLAEHDLQMRFTLDAGHYATSVVRELAHLRSSGLSHDVNSE